MFETKVVEKIKTLNYFFIFENHSFNEMMWKNIEKSDRPQMTVLRMRISLWIHKATNTHTICNISCVSTTTTVARTRRNITLQVHCMCCCYFC